MSKFIIKALSLLLIIVFNWTGFLFVEDTFTFFNDRAGFSSNSFSAATLDFSLRQAPTEPLDFFPHQWFHIKTKLINQGSLLFLYTIEPRDFSGQLCDYLDLKAKLREEIKYSGSLKDFRSEPIKISNPYDYWIFIVSFKGGLEEYEEYKNESCQFNLVLRAWQDNQESYQSSGFRDEEKAFFNLILRPKPPKAEDKEIET